MKLLIMIWDCTTILYKFLEKNPYLWMIPVFFRSGKPIGDGVVWPQKPSKAQTYDVDANKDTPDAKSNVEMTSRQGANFDNSAPEKNVGLVQVNSIGTTPYNTGIPVNAQSQFISNPNATPVVQQRLNLNDPSTGTSQRLIADNMQLSMQSRPIDMPPQGNSNIMANYMSFSNTQPLYEKFVEH